MYFVHFFFFHFRGKQEPERRCDIYKGIWWGVRKMHQGRTQPSGHMTGRLRWLCAKEEMPSFRWTQSQASMWLTELSSGGCQLPVPDLRYTNLALYKGSLRGSPVHLIQIGVGNITQ